MATEVVMPQMGESIAEGTITKWLKHVGDHVDRDEPLFEISTDKVDAEIPSPAAGTLTEIRFKEGDTVEINTTVAVLDGDASSAAKDAPTTEDAVAKAEAPKESPAPEPETKAKKADAAPQQPQVEATAATSAEVQPAEQPKAATTPQPSPPSSSSTGNGGSAVASAEELRR